MASKLEVSEGLQYQSASEELSYKITTTNWASTPTSPTVVVYDEADGSGVTLIVMPTNSPGVAGDIITLSPLKNLSEGHTYRIEIKFTATANIWECFFRVSCPL